MSICHLPEHDPLTGFLMLYRNSNVPVWGGVLFLEFFLFGLIWFGFAWLGFFVVLFYKKQLKEIQILKRWLWK